MEANKVPVPSTSGSGATVLVADARSSPRTMPGLTPDARRGLAVSGLWSGLGFIGAGVLAAGLLMLVNGGIGAAIALVMIVAGGAVATVGWRGAWKALAALEPRPAEAAGVSVAGD